MSKESLQGSALLDKELYPDVKVPRAAKLGMQLVPAEYDLWLAEIFQMGAEKYSPNGWIEHPMPREIMEGSMLRHLVKWRMGETLDEESGLHHLAHTAWNVLGQLYYEKKGLQK